MPPPAAPVSNVKAIKKSAFSCEPCRRRKVKCGGEQPCCNRCSMRKEVCLYKLGPTLSYTQRLERRIQELESQLKGPVQSPASGGPLTPRDPPSGSETSTSRTTFEGLKLDDKGSITFHGPTSFFQLPGDKHDDAACGKQPAIDPRLNMGTEQRERLVNNAWQQRILENLADTPEPFGYLLRSHWCWIQPLFNFVYRPAFTRDMESLGPYYSHMLMNAMLSHSVRWCKADPQISVLLHQYDGGASFARQARTLLFEDLTDGHSKIPTIQTLLLLSAQESGRGNRTQAWLYSGMAFRLVEDMGINIDSQKFAGSVQLSDEDIEIRRRLFWSCYFYDKMISLYLGRSPSIQDSRVSPPQLMLDDSAETELWTPHGVEYAEGVEYPPTQAHSISCFVRMCQLSTILNQILIHIYDPFHQNTDSEIENCLHQQAEALRVFWDELPPFLQIDVKSMPQYCPPSHIVTLNCLYHTFKILLYRPMLSRRTSGGHLNPEHLLECIASATSIIAIFDLFCKCFGDGHVVLSLSYSVYTAASIFLLQIQAASSQDEQTLRRLDFCMRGLDRVKHANPVIGSALKLITHELQKLKINIGPQLVRHELPFDPTQPDRENLNQTRFLPSHAAPIPNLGQATFHSEPAFQLPAPEDFNLEGFEITPEMFAAFSSLEPISATVGVIDDIE